MNERLKKVGMHVWTKNHPSFQINYSKLVGTKKSFRFVEIHLCRIADESMEVPMYGGKYDILLVKKWTINEDKHKEDMDKYKKQLEFILVRCEEGATNKELMEFVKELEKTGE